MSGSWDTCSDEPPSLALCAAEQGIDATGSCSADCRRAVSRENTDCARPHRRVCMSWMEVIRGGKYISNPTTSLLES